jgi:hypothetical protein
MPETHTLLFRTPCFGATIAHVQVFPTHITYQQKFGRDITVQSHTIASVEKRVYEYGFVILATASRRRIICMVNRNRVDALYRAICIAQRILDAQLCLR